jgi:uncharacterized protein with von Willebrand factor type A (vWA) domain
MRLGDARSGKLADNLCAFGRTLRRAGLSVDASRMALASEAALLVGLASRQDVCAALESILVSREADRMVFRELFDAYFRDPEMANKLLSQMLPSAEGKAEPSKRRPRVREALTPLQAAEQAKPKAKPDQKIDLDAAMTASDAARLRHADFNGLSASEYQLVQRLVRDIALPIPSIPTRRARSGLRGGRPHWPGILHEAAQTGGKCCACLAGSGRRQPCRCWCWWMCRVRWSVMRGCCSRFCMRQRRIHAVVTCSLLARI